MGSFLRILKILKSLNFGLIEEIMDKIRELVVLLRRLFKVNETK